MNDTNYTVASDVAAYRKTFKSLVAAIHYGLKLRSEGAGEFGVYADSGAALYTSHNDTFY